MDDGEDRVIRASEVGQYGFCSQAWWLGSVRGLPSAHQQELAAGQLAHHRHGWSVRVAAGLVGLAAVLLGLAAVALLIGLWQLQGG